MKTRLHRWTTLTALLLVALTVTATAGNKVWEPLPRLPYIGSINNIALAADGTLYATTGDHVYRSHADHYDQTWTPIGEDVFWGTISDVTTDPEDPNVIVVSTDTRVFWTRNGGVSWNSQRFEVNPHTGLGGGAGTVQIHPLFKTIFADSYLLRMDGAWQRIIPNKWVFSFIFPHDNSAIGISNGSPMADVVRSVNGGQSWTTVGSVPGMGLLYLGKEDRIYGIFERYETTTSGTIRTHTAMSSNDLGATWTEIQPKFEGLPAKDVRITILAVDSTNDRIYATVEDPGYNRSKGIYYSDDMMQTWTLLDPSLKNIEPVEIVLAYEGRIFIATMRNGVLEYKPSHSGQVQERNNGIFSYRANTLMITHTDDILVHSYGGIQISNNGGYSWHQSGTDIISPSSMIDLPSGDIFVGSIGYASSQSPRNYSALYHSTNNGDTWTPLGEELVSTNGNWTQVTNLFADNNNRLYATTQNSGDTALPYGLYTSTDNGAHWQAIGEALPTTMVTPSGVIFTVGMTKTFSFDFLRSSDLGVTWDTLTPPFPISFNSNPVLMTGPDNALYFFAQNTAVAVSFDNGITWTTDSYQQFRTYFDHEGNAYRIYEQSIYYIDRISTKPVEISAGLPDLATVSLINMDFDTDNVPFLSLSDGRIFKLVEAASTGVEETTPATSRAYPNPFTDAVTIEYSLPTSAPVTLTVTDIPGRIVSTLQTPQQQAGTHTVSLEGSTLAPGLYIYKIVAGSFVQTGTIIRR